MFRRIAALALAVAIVAFTVLIAVDAGAGGLAGTLALAIGFVYAAVVLVALWRR